MTSREATLNIENARRLGNIPVQIFISKGGLAWKLHQTDSRKPYAIDRVHKDPSDISPPYFFVSEAEAKLFRDGLIDGRDYKFFATFS